ncbi:hypothetical protein EDB83DRAFT_2422631 [Lactarius deliciosus]|nr:hypothetical protein EDB83DRAFT_2422631 [Lactarius deliciosus]
MGRRNEQDMRRRTTWGTAHAPPSPGLHAGATCKRRACTGMRTSAPRTPFAPCPPVRTQGQCANGGVCSNLEQSPQVCVHVFQSWQQIIFGPPLGLHLRLYYTYGTPVLKTLHCWPPFPLVVNYGGFPRLRPPVPGDEDNIMTALEQSDRVCFVTTSPDSCLINAGLDS